MKANNFAHFLAVFIIFLSRSIAYCAPDHHRQDIYFMENNGQVKDQYGCPRTDIQYSLKAPGINIFIGGALHYQFYKPKGDSVATYRIDVELVGANTGAAAIEEEPQVYYENYYLPGYMRNGIQAHSCKRITYKNVYPHIDWVILAKGNKMEYEFVVKEGGDRTRIKLKYSGQTSLRLDNTDGSIIATTPMGFIKEHAPECYQADGKLLPSVFKLADNMLSYDVQREYKGSLLIDPALEWGTYYGSDTNVTYLVTLASIPGYIYGGGWTRTVTAGVIATSGSYDDTYGGGEDDAFLVKFDSTGARIWGTYYGGSGSNAGNSVACDSSGNIYLGGGTASADSIATPGSQQPVFGGGGDGFLVKFNSAGTRLWATYCGGSETDLIQSVSCDRTGNVVVAGTTGSANNISTPGSCQPSFQDTSDLFVIKYDSNGTRLWGSYYGGDAYAASVCVDNGNNIYISGQTNSLDSIATPGSFQTENAGEYDLFLVKFDSMGVRQWATYYGGPGFENEGGVICDSDGNIYMAGGTTSTTGITTAGSQQPVYGGGASDAFLVKFNPTGMRQWATYYGGMGVDAVGWNTNYTSLAMDDSGNIYMCGLTNSDSAIATPDGYQTTLGGDVDAFLAKYDSAGQLRWGTYYGGSDQDFGYACAVSGNGVYITGWTKSLNNIATPGSFKSTRITGDEDGFLAKFAYPTTEVKNIAAVKPNIFVYPAINNGSFTLTGNNINTGSLQIEVINMNGNVILQEACEVNYGAISRAININNFPAGSYIVKVVSPDDVQVLRIIKE